MLDQPELDSGPPAADLSALLATPASEFRYCRSSSPPSTRWGRSMLCLRRVLEAELHETGDRGSRRRLDRTAHRSATAQALE